MSGLFLIPVLFIAFTDLGLVNLFYSKTGDAEQMNSSKQQSCIYYERFSRRKYNKDEVVANKLKERDKDSDFLYCRSSFKKALGFTHESVLAEDMFEKIQPSLNKTKNYSVVVWSKKQRLAKKMTTKLEVQLFEAGYKVNHKYQTLKSLSDTKKTCTNNDSSQENIHILYEKDTNPRLGICSSKGWKWI